MRRRDLVPLARGQLVLPRWTGQAHCPVCPSCDPSIFQWCEYVVAGGFVNYGMSLAAAYRQMGVYVGRVPLGREAAPRAGLAVSISVWVMSVA